MWFLFIFLFALAITLCCLHVLIHSSERAKIFNKIRGPALTPFFGNATNFICQPAELFYKGRALANTYPLKYRIWGVDRTIINLYDPYDYEIILSSSKHITKSYLYDFLHPWLNEGLLTSTGEKWHTRRKILTPAFHFNILKQFLIVFREQSEKLVESLRPEVEKDETEIIPHISNFTLKTICETAMGANLDKIPIGERELYIKNIKEMSRSFIKRFVRMWLQPSLLFALSGVAKKQKRILKILHTFTKSVINERRVARKDSNFFESDVAKKSKNRLAMLDLLLVAEKEGKIDDNGIREEVDTFMFEGHDTTTMAITFCLMSLANNADAQNKVYREIKSIYDDNSDDVFVENLNKLNYLEMCLKETLRLYPSVTMLGRVVTEDVTLNGYVIPAGTTCHMHVFDMHRRADIYVDPMRFDPERFSKDNVAQRHPFAYVPFSAGPRNCIGQKFAMLEMKTVISEILRNFQLLPVTKPNDIIFTADLILKPKDPIKIRFVPRVRDENDNK